MKCFGVLIKMDLQEVVKYLSVETLGQMFVYNIFVRLGSGDSCYKILTVSAM